MHSSSLVYPKLEYIHIWPVTRGRVCTVENDDGLCTELSRRLRMPIVAIK